MRSIKRGLILLIVVLVLGSSFVLAGIGTNLFGPGAPPPHQNNFTDTKWIPAAPWLYGSGDTLYFNESYLSASLNDTLSNLNCSNNQVAKWNSTSGEWECSNDNFEPDTDTWWPISGPYLINDSGILKINTTKLIETIELYDNDTLTDLNCNNGQVAKWNNSGGNWYCADDDYEPDTDTHIASVGPYLYDDYTNIYFNETLLNETILFYNQDTQKNATGYLYNDSTTIYLNETSLNQTIDARDTDTWWQLIGPYLFNNSNQLDFNESQLNETIKELDTDTHVEGDGNYLYNDSTTMYLNESKLNETIDARDTFYLDTWWPLFGKWLYNFSNQLRFNETLLNQTIQVLDTDTQKDGGSPYLYNDSTTIYLNETQLNATIQALDQFEADTQKNAVGPYLYNDSVNIYFNGTLLNETILYYNIDTQKNTTGPYLYNDSTTIYYNETYLNVTISNLDTDTRVEGTGYLYNDSVYMYLNETLLNQTIKALDQFEADTQKDAAGPYLYNDSTTIYLNETYLNATIDARDTFYPDTQKGTQGPYLYNNSALIYFNETLLNFTIQNLDSDTWWPILGPYLFNNSNQLDFNDTLLNQTIQALDQFEADTQKDADGPYLYNDSTTIYFNETYLNLTIQQIDTIWLIDNYWLINDSGNLTINETLLNETILAHNIDTQKTTSGPYLYNDSTTIYFNETTLNNTIDARDTDTHVEGDGIYLYNDTTIMYLNETKLNQTIEALDDFEADTQKNASLPYLYNDSTTIYLNETHLNSTIDARDDYEPDTQKDSAGPYLYNDSTTIYFNESYLNGTIGVLDTDTWWTILGPYLFNNSNQLDFNETKLNATIDARDQYEPDTQKDTSGPYLYNDSTTIYMNETYLNGTIDARDTDTDTWWTILGPYLYNNSNQLDFNETKLNETIDARDQYEADTRVEGTGYLYNDSIYMYLNETELNATIDARDQYEADTQKNASEPYLYNDSTTIYLNETYLNYTIVQLDTDTQWLLDNNYLYNNSGTLTFNETKMNETIEALDSDYCRDGNCSGNLTVNGILNITGYDSGNILLSEIDMYIGDTYGAMDVGSYQMFISDFTFQALDFNGSVTYRNAFTGGSAIDFLWVTGNNKITLAIPETTSGLAMYNPRSLIIGGDLGQSFNTSVVNCSAQGFTLIDCDTTGSDLGVSGDAEIRGWLFVEEAINTSGNVTADWFFGKINWSDVQNPPSFTDTQKNTSGPYLYNDSSTIYLNETYLNQTINTTVVELQDIENWVTVAKSGGDFTTIQAAVDSITDAAANKKYVVYVYPGVYAETVTLKDYVSLEGTNVDGQETVIQGTDTLLTMNTVYSSVKNILFDFNFDGINERAVSVNGGEHEIINCKFDVDSSTNAVNGRVIYVTGVTNITLRHNEIDYDYTGNDSTVRVHVGIYIAGTDVDYIAENNRIEMDVYDGNDGITGFIDAVNSTATSLIKGNVIFLEATGPTYNYIAAVYYTNGDGGPKVFEENHFEVKGPGTGTGHLLYIDSTTDNVVVDTFSNYGDVRGFASNHVAYVGTGDEMNSVFNRVHAGGSSNGSSYGPGNVTYVTSYKDGHLLISGNLTVWGSGFFGNNSVYVGDVKISQGGDGTLNVSQNVTAPYYIGDGSRLWNISELWDNVSGIATYRGTINVTGDVYLNQSSLKFVGTDGSVGNLSRDLNQILYWNGVPFAFGIYVNQSGDDWLYVDSTNVTMFFNESKLNQTIDARIVFYNITDTQKQADGIYLYNDSDTIYFNETLLNNTIDARDQYEPNTDTWWPLFGKWLYNFSNQLRFNETLLNETISNLDTDTQKTTEGPYLYNNSNTVYFNESYLNNTIDVRDTNTDTWWSLIPKWLFNNSGSLDFNETLLNETIDARVTALNITDTQKNSSGPYLYNDSTTIYYNDTLLNETIIYLSDINSYQLNLTVNVVGGTGTTISTNTINYLITQIIVTPPGGASPYRFEMNETTSGLVIDSNKKKHNGIWNIYKSHSLNDTVTAKIFDAGTDGSYIVTIKYIDNVIQI